MWTPSRRLFAILLLVIGAYASIPRRAVAELFVLRVGDGAASLSNASTPTFVDRFNNDGAPSASPTIALPTSVSGQNKPLTNSGSATSEGMLALSPTGQYLTFAGYAVAPGTVDIANTDSATVNRVVGRIDVSTGAVDTTTAFSDDSYSGANIRGAVTTNGTDLWTSGTADSGANGGVRFATLGSTSSTQITSTPTNTRVVGIANNQLYVSSMAGAFRGVSRVGDPPPPTTAGQTTTLLPGFDPATNSPESAYEFWFKDANTLYVADDRQAPNGGIQKWQFDGGAMTWSLAYTLVVGAGAGSGARGLAGAVDGSNNAVLYATTTESNANRLITVTDTGAASMFSLLATAGANTAFRGLEFVAGGVNPVIDADFDNRNGVDGHDFLVWQRGLGVGTTNATGDANGDGVVNAADLAAWKSKFGTATVSAADAVPEPAALFLGAMALVGGAGLRRRAPRIAT